MNKKTSKEDNTVIMSDKYISESGVQGGKIIGEHIALGSFIFGIPFLIIGLIALFGMLFGFGFPILFLVLMLIASFFLFYYFYSMPFRLAVKWRLKASSQMVPAILYTVIYMKHTSNLERAISFVAEHVEAPLSLDLRKVLWDVETGKYSSIKSKLLRTSISA